LTLVTGIATHNRISPINRLVYFGDHFDHLAGSLFLRLIVGWAIDETVFDQVTRAALKA
jgi:hypothetical protein